MPHLHLFDVRPIIARGEHPLTEALALAAQLQPGDELELFAPFEPRPLVDKLRAQGCEVAAALHGGVWVVRVGTGQLTPLHDFSDLPAPEPMERALVALAGQPFSAPLLLRLPRHPALLVEQLKARGFEWEAGSRPDGSAVLWARKAPP